MCKLLTARPAGKRIAVNRDRVIVADYNCSMKPGPGALLARGIERAAGGDHYRNFRKYMMRGGVGKLADEAEMTISGIEVCGHEVFAMVRLKNI